MNINKDKSASTDSLPGGSSHFSQTPTLVVQDTDNPLLTLVALCQAI
ncbi:MAG: hypothetical protein ACREEM_36500 [Blastocatellia bacterium]